MLDNFQIYYQPNKNSKTDIKSISLKLYNFDEENDTYKKKTIIEYHQGEDKTKDVFSGIQYVANKINEIDFNRNMPEQIDYNDEYYLVQFGSKKLETNNIEDVSDILIIFGFPKVKR